MRTVEETVLDLDEALNRKDLDAVLRFYDENAVLVMEPGRVAKGAKEIRSFFEIIFRMNIKANQLSTHVLQAGDTALFTSKWVAEGVLPDGEMYSNEHVATSVFKKGSDQAWRMVIDNSFGPAVLDTPMDR